MGNEIQMHDVTAQVRDKIRCVFVELLTDEQIDGLVRSEWESFFAKQERSFGGGLNKSKFELLIEEILRERLHEALSGWFDANFQQQFDSDTQRHKIVGKYVAKMLPIVQEAYFQNVIENSLTALRTAMGQY